MKNHVDYIYIYICQPKKKHWVVRRGTFLQIHSLFIYLISFLRIKRFFLAKTKQAGKIREGIFIYEYIVNTRISLKRIKPIGGGGKQLFRYFDIYICLHSLAATGGVGGVGRMRWKDTIICLSGVRQEYRFEINFKGAQKYAVDFSSGPKFKFIVNQFPVFCGTLLGATYC